MGTEAIRSLLRHGALVLSSELIIKKPGDIWLYSSSSHIVVPPSDNQAWSCFTIIKAHKRYVMRCLRSYLSSFFPGIKAWMRIWMQPSLVTMGICGGCSLPFPFLPKDAPSGWCSKCNKKIGKSEADCLIIDVRFYFYFYPLMTLTIPWLSFITIEY